MKKTLITLLAFLMSMTMFVACGDGSSSGVPNWDDDPPMGGLPDDLGGSTGGDDTTGDDNTGGSTGGDTTGGDATGGDEPTIKVEAPSRKISAVRGNSVGLKKYLITEGEEEFDVSFSYTFNGYGEMGANGAQALEITTPVDIDGESLTLSYCGEYTIWFVATQDGGVISEENACFTVVAEDESLPTITPAQDVVFEESEVAVSEFLTNVTVSDEYYKTLDVTVTKVNGVDFSGDTLSFNEGANTVELAVNDGFENSATATANVTLQSVVYEDLSVLATIGGKVTHDFDKTCSLLDFESSALANSVVSEENAINGNSLTIDNTNSAPSLAFLKNNQVALNGQYKVTFDYKVLTDNAPNYFCVGFNGTVQINKENWFAGKTETKGETYRFEHTFTLAEGNYYLQIFNLNADGSKIVIDNITIENVTEEQKLSDLNTVGGKITHDFDDKVIFGDHYCSDAHKANVSIGTDNAVGGKSMTMDNTGVNPTAYFFLTNNLALNGQYKVTLDYKVLTDNAPNYFCVGFNGTAQINKENWFADKTETKGETYRFEHTFTLAEGNYYLQIFNLNADGSKIVIDNIVIEKVA